MSMTPLKATVLCLMTAGLVGLGALGAGAVLKENAFARPLTGGPEDQARAPAASPKRAARADRSARQAQAAIEDAGATVTFKGRVLDPDGKPLAGAEVTLWCHLGYWGFYRAWHPENAGPFRPMSLATSGADGRFTATFRKSDLTENPLNMWERPWRLVQAVAAAKGYGPDWAPLERLNKGELVLKLARDDAPVKGRVLNLEGRPVVGAAVRVVRVGNDTIGSLWQPSWAGLSDNVTTDRDGRFRLSGLGRGREVLLSIESDRIEHKLVVARTLAADAGPEIQVVVRPTKPIEGTVRIKGTGRPLAGVVVYGEEEAHHRRVRAVTNAQGRYRLVGLPKAEAYTLTVYPPLATTCLSTLAKVADTEGLRPITADLEVRRGVEVRCRLIDKVTGEPVRADINYTPLSANPLYAEAELAPGLIPSREFGRVHVPGPDGVFHFVAYPGLGLLVVNLQGNMSRYLHRPAIKPADLARAKGDPTMGFARLFGIYRLIDPKEGDRPLTVEIALDPGRKASGFLIGPDGKPVTGATAYDLNYHPNESLNTRGGQLLETDAFTATLLEPGRPRTVTFFQKGRKLIGRVVLRGDETVPQTVRMEPWGVLTGRLVDDAGHPLADVRVSLKYPDLPPPGMRPSDREGRTDRDGRFRVEGLLPGLDHDLILHRGTQTIIALSAGESLKKLKAGEGEVNDLGNVAVKAAPVPKTEK